MRRRKGRRPTATSLTEKRKHVNTSKVDLPISEMDKAWLDTFLGRIFFWSFTTKKVYPDEHSTKFRVCTHRYVPKHKLIPRVEAVFPDGCNVKLVTGYNFRQTFDVKTTAPVRWDAFIWRVTKALEDVL